MCVCIAIIYCICLLYITYYVSIIYITDIHVYGKDIHTHMCIDNRQRKRVKIEEEKLL